MRTRLLAAGTTLSLATVMTLPAAATPADEATVSVLHAVPGLTVDVYVDGEELIPDFEPGTLTDPLQLPAGTYDVEIYADGDGPDGEPAISAPGVEVAGGDNATIVAHLDAAGAPTGSVFANDVSTLEAGQARLTVRHTAAAPAVDVRADGTAAVEGLENPDEAALDLPAGTVTADVTLAGTEDVVIGPADLDLAEGTNTIVYAWGSAEDDTLDLAVQTIDGLHGSPDGVPGGEAGLVPAAGSGTPWALAAALGLVAVGGTGILLGLRRRTAGSAH